VGKKKFERPVDPRILRSKRAAIEAAGRAFLRHGYTATTMDDIAHEAGLTKRTLYNHYDNKDTLFLEAINDMVTFAEGFSKRLDRAYFETVAHDPEESLHELGRRFALAVVRPQVISLRRLLITEGDRFPGLAKRYYDRAPGSVLSALTRGFQQLHKRSTLRIDDPRTAAEHYTYLVVGAQLDQAILTAKIPSQKKILKAADAGVQAFLLAYT
jgi:TetR/AcrR family transcriptional regulator, mexJK operon transcriptional repressor